MVIREARLKVNLKRDLKDHYVYIIPKPEPESMTIQADTQNEHQADRNRDKMEVADRNSPNKEGPENHIINGNGLSAVDLMQRKLAVAAAAAAAAASVAAQQSRLSFSVDSLLGKKTETTTTPPESHHDEDDENIAVDDDDVMDEEDEEPENLSVDVDDDNTDEKSVTSDTAKDSEQEDHKGHRIVMPTPLNPAGIRFPPVSLGPGGAGGGPQPNFLAGIAAAMAAAANGGANPAGAFPGLFPPPTSSALLHAPGLGPHGQAGLPVPGGLVGLHHHLFKSGGKFSKNKKNPLDFLDLSIRIFVLTVVTT